MRISDWSSDVCSSDLQRRLVRDIARSEEQRGFLAVKIGQFAFEIDMVMRVAADVARAARAGADIVQRLFHRRDHIGMLAHRQIIVRAPDRDRLRPVMPGEASRVGAGALVAQDIRSEERRVGKEGGSTCRSRWYALHKKKK